MTRVVFVLGLDLNKENTAVLDKSHCCLPGSVWWSPSGSRPEKDKILAQPEWPVLARLWFFGWPHVLLFQYLADSTYSLKGDTGTGEDNTSDKVNNAIITTLSHSRNLFLSHLSCPHVFLVFNELHNCDHIPITANKTEQ